MHLSMLSAGIMSEETTAVPAGEDRSFGRAHRDGVVRGALFALLLAVPPTLTAILSPAQDARPAQPNAATHLRITHLAVR